MQTPAGCVAQWGGERAGGRRPHPVLQSSLWPLKSSALSAPALWPGAMVSFNLGIFQSNKALRLLAWNGIAVLKQKEKWEGGVEVRFVLFYF